jgi:hypothetical protein
VIEKTVEERIQKHFTEELTGMFMNDALILVADKLDEMAARLKEAREVIGFYAKKEVWGVDAPHIMTSIDPCDQEQLDAWGTRGGKRARAYLEKWK